MMLLAFISGVIFGVMALVVAVFVFMRGGGAVMDPNARPRR